MIFSRSKGLRKARGRVQGPQPWGSACAKVAPHLTMVRLITPATAPDRSVFASFHWIGAASAVAASLDAAVEAAISVRGLRVP